MLARAMMADVARAQRRHRWLSAGERSLTETCAEQGEDWMRGTCASMGYSHLWYATVWCRLPALFCHPVQSTNALLRCMRASVSSCDDRVCPGFELFGVLRGGAAVRRSEDQKTGLAMYKNFKRLGATWDNSNNAA